MSYEHYNHLIIECSGYNTSFYEELKYHYKEIKINDDTGVVFLIGEKQKLIDTLIKIYQETLFGFGVDAMQNAINKACVKDFVYRKWPELKPHQN